MKTTWGNAAALTLALLAVTATAQEAKKKSAAKDLAGTWAGTLKVTPQVELRLVLNVEKAEGGSFKANLVSPDQSPEEIPVDSIELKGDSLTFSVKAVDG
jgi:hypothetical protein